MLSQTKFASVSHEFRSVLVTHAIATTNEGRHKQKTFASLSRNTIEKKKQKTITEAIAKCY